MRNTHIDLHDALDRALVAIGNDYPAGHLLDAHAHRRAQLLYGATGVMLVLSEDGGWVVPPQRAVWIPAGVTHQVRMLGSARAAPTSSRARRARTHGPAKWWRCRRCCASCCWRPWTCRRSTTGRARRRAGPAAAARGGPRAGAAAASRCRATRGWGVVPGLHGGAGHPLAAAGLGRAAAHEPAQLQPPFPRAHRHVLRPMASARLRGAGAGAAGGGRSRHRHRADFGYQGPAAFSTMFRRVLGAAPSAYLRTD